MKRLMLLTLITLSTIGSLSQAAQKSCCDCSCLDGVRTWWYGNPVAPAQAAPAPNAGVPQGLPAQLPMAPAPAMVAFAEQQAVQLVSGAMYQAPQGQLDENEQPTPRLPHEQQRVRRQRAAARADEQPDAVPQDENAVNGLPSQGPMGAGLLDVDAPVQVGLATGALELARLQAIERAQQAAIRRQRDEEIKRQQAERKAQRQGLPAHDRHMQFFDPYNEDRTVDYVDTNPVTGMGGRYHAAAAAANMDDADGPAAGAGADMTDQARAELRASLGYGYGVPRPREERRFPGQGSPAHVHHHHYHGSSIVVNQGGIVNIGKYSPSNSDERREPASVGPAAAAASEGASTYVETSADRGAGAGAASGQVRTMVARQAEIEADRNKALRGIILDSVDAVGGLSIAELAKLTNSEAEEQSTMEQNDPNGGLHVRIMAHLAFKKDSELRVPSVDGVDASPLLAILMQGDKAGQAAAANALPDFEQL